MADSLDSGSSVHYARAGSSPASRTNKKSRNQPVSGFFVAIFQLFNHIHFSTVYPLHPTPTLHVESMLNRSETPYQKQTSGSPLPGPPLFFCITRLCANSIQIVPALPGIVPGRIIGVVIHQHRVFIKPVSSMLVAHCGRVSANGGKAICAHI